MKVTEKHYNIIRQLVTTEYNRQLVAGFTFQDKINFYSNNPKIKCPFTASLWKLFYESDIPFEVKQGYTDVHLETAMKKILKELMGGTG